MAGGERRSGGQAAGLAGGFDVGVVRVGAADVGHVRQGRLVDRVDRGRLGEPVVWLNGKETE